jgi:hypothetical protein
MDPLTILALLNGILGAAPQLLALFNRATSGTPVSNTEVQAVLSQYGIDRAVFAAAIAKAEADASVGTANPSG